MLLLVIPTMTYSKTIPVMVGTKIINKAMSLMTMGELANATTTLRQAHFGAVMLGSLQLSCSSSGKCKVTAGATSSFQQGGTVEVWKFWLNDIKGLICTMQKVTIPPFSIINIQANTSVKGHCMWVHVLTEPVLGPQIPAAVVLRATYGDYTLVPQGYQSVCTIWVPMPWMYLLEWSLGRLCLPIKYLQWSTQQGLLQRPNTQHKRDGFWRL